MTRAVLWGVILSVENGHKGSEPHSQLSLIVLEPLGLPLCRVLPGHLTSRALEPQTVPVSVPIVRCF